MAHASFDYRYFVNAPAVTIYEHLAQPENYVGLSPLIVAVDQVEPGTDGDGHPFVRYRSVERFKFLGVIRYDNLLHVTMIFTQRDRQIVSDVDSPFGVKVRFTFDLEPGDGGTWIHETISAQMPLILKGFVISEAKRVQQERARELKRRLEPVA